MKISEQSSRVCLALAVCLLGGTGIVPAFGEVPRHFEIQRLTADRGLGWTVALDGDYALLGSLLDNAAYVFTRANGSWVLDAKLTPADAVTYSGFGASVAIDGDTAFVGTLRGGGAYVFRRNGEIWSEEQKLTLASSELERIYTFVEVDGGTAAVSTYRQCNDMYAPDCDAEGLVHIFDRVSDTWLLAATIANPGSGPGDGYFGWAHALENDTLLVGAQIDEALGMHSGAVFVFTKENGVWGFRSRLKAEDGGFGGLFGYSLSLDGNRVLIGSPGAMHMSAQSGAVYVFERHSGNWIQTAKLVSEDFSGQDSFGFSVALDRNIAVATAPNDDEQGFLSGSASVFVQNDGTWEEKAKLLPSDGAEWDLFGYPDSTAAISKGTIMVGAVVQANTNTPSAVYVFDGSFGQVPLEVKVTVRPGEFVECTKLTGKGVVPVLIHGSESFDVLQVDRSSVRLDSFEVRIRGNEERQCELTDGNDDAFVDLVCHFEFDSDAWQPKGEAIEVSGELFDGATFIGTASRCQQ